MLDKNMTEYTNHPAAELFPMMEQGELQQLADDIKQNGQLEPVILYHGQVLDGRNRLAACRLANLSARFSTVNGEINDPWLYVLSRNLHRRHLTVSQRAAIAAEALPFIIKAKAQAQEVRDEHGRFGPSGEIATAGRSREIVAKTAQVDPATVQRAWAVKQSDPETFEKVKRGELTVNAAYGGHKEQPKIGGGQRDPNTPYIPDTPRKQQVAEAQKKKMEVGLAAVGGTCHGLEHLDVVITVSVCTEEEVELWATKAEQHASDLRKFAKRLRGAKNG